MHISLFLILFSSITIFATYASEEQKSIPGLLAKQRIKRARIIIADDSTASANTAHKKAETLETCSKDTCDTCSQKIIDQNLGW
jgi:hypothetical protein